MTPAKIMDILTTLAPSVAFTCSKTLDRSAVWDGDGPAPEGMDAYTVEVTAKAIIGGKIVEATAYLSGCYMTPSQPIGDLDGYLPQKLSEAAGELLSLIPNPKGMHAPLAMSLTKVKTFLKGELKNRWLAQQAKKRATA